MAAIGSSSKYSSSSVARIALVCSVMAVMAIPAASLDRAEARTEPAADAQYTAVPRAECAPDDPTETALQGQVPLADRLSGRSLEGYRCNLELVGQFQGEGASWQHAWYKECSYYDTANSPNQEHRGTVVIDASDPTKPTATEYLDEAAMLDPWESLKVNQKRGLLAGVENGGPGFAIYDLKKDCAHPKLLADIVVPRGNGHAGNFAPDGKTYYGASTSAITSVLDVSKPSRPRPLLDEHWAPPVSGIHDFSFSEDGTRGYIATIGQIVGGIPVSGRGLITGPNGLVIVDTSEIQQRRQDPQIKVISELYWEDGSTGQMTQPVTIGGKPYLIFVDELGSGGIGGFPAYANACARGLPPYGFARIIDISDEKNPKIVSKLMLEVQLPENCPLTINDNTGSPSFGYDGHYCTVDDPRNARLLGCSYFQSGLRVFDIRKPAKPREIAYYNPPARPFDDLPASQHHQPRRGVQRYADWTSANVRFRLDRGQIWFTSQDNGFQIVRFTKPLKKLF